MTLEPPVSDDYAGAARPRAIARRRAVRPVSRSLAPRGRARRARPPAVGLPRVARGQAVRARRRRGLRRVARDRLLRRLRRRTAAALEPGPRRALHGRLDAAQGARRPIDVRSGADRPRSLGALRRARPSRPRLGDRVDDRGHPRVDRRDGSTSSTPTAATVRPPTSSAPPRPPGSISPTNERWRRSSPGGTREATSVEPSGPPANPEDR